MNKIVSKAIILAIIIASMVLSVASQAAAASLKGSSGSSSSSGGGKASSLSWDGTSHPAPTPIIVTEDGSSSGGSNSSGGGSSGSYMKLEIPGCGFRTTGFSTVTGQSCLRNIPHSEGQVLGAEKFNFTIFLKVGSRGNEVTGLQKLLTSAGYFTDVIGNDFGPQTKMAVIRFQLANGLAPDGIVGPLTRAVLNR